jgi:aspartate aminotransferase-like enzyme/GNAT superfamily N-acetyltransferase
MSDARHLTFKVASEPWEFEAIHRLNYRTFVEEIPQHDRNNEERLVDRFHDQNVYIICVAGQSLAGMMAMRFQRPFSLDGKLPDLDAHLPPGRTWCELRLLAVEPKHRGTSVTAGLMRRACREAAARGVDAGVISATTRQLKLYRHLGFEPFGPLVGREGAFFQPMYSSMEKFEAEAPILSRSYERAGTSAGPAAAAGPVNLLPGPVAIPSVVREAFIREPVSHRATRFIDDVQTVRRLLCELTGANYVQIMLGSGTLANEIVCSQLARLDSPGMVVSNGEFGERLADQARRSWLTHEHLCLPWGHPLNVAKLDHLLDRHPEVRWIWTTHCETSTSALNDLEALKQLCASRDIRLALDAISSVGVVPVDLSGVWMASCASGKGLASYPGVAIVFHQDAVDPAPEKLPRYLDLGLYASSDGVPFTQSSNLVYALKASLENTDWPEKFARVRRLHDRVRPRLAELGATFKMAENDASPAVITLPMPDGVNSLDVADRLEAAGFLLSCRSTYLSTRNWLQVCLMGDLTDADVDAFLTRIGQDNPWG